MFVFADGSVVVLRAVAHVGAVEVCPWHRDKRTYPITLICGHVLNRLFNGEDKLCEERDELIEALRANG